MALADSKTKKETRQKKIVERRTKRAFEPGRTFGQGKAGEKLPERRRCYKRHRWLVSEKQPESKRRDPWHRANASPKAMADSMQMVKTRKRES
jgi:hypothetical protein